MVGLVIVSHSERAADGIKEIAAEMAGDTQIEAVGGDGDGGIGTSATEIQDALDAISDGEAVVLVDLGSAVMNAELAIEMSATDAEIADAPVLEGAVNAAVSATSPKATLESVLEAANEAGEISKV
ncbi:dihydroxyacetone kinase phosphoryl donor subunit DhaM [Haladaptatus caseinilyticus]|uniref:dihydroxyacetone kinase phosphoryl donor subunit DhaM n=1 Tax=Haladaptatus caseinilyticus TaxID=2993314 RepID=UPI00224B528E|nr:dihydroxyacetone kinase phosphoryl donor subunit DhaM [Haladaptatus caseinilyticus]